MHLPTCAARLAGTAKLQLSTLAAHIGHDFNHHHAQADAEAAGRVMLAMMKRVNASTARALLEKTGLRALTRRYLYE